MIEKLILVSNILKDKTNQKKIKIKMSFRKQVVLNELY